MSSVYQEEDIVKNALEDIERDHTWSIVVIIVTERLLAGISLWHTFRKKILSPRDINLISILVLR